MKAVIATAFGQPDVLVVQDVQEPVPGPGEVLVRVKSAGINFGDTVIRAGKAPHAPITPPYIPGCEVAGVIEKLGDGVTGLSVGDRVVALLYLTGQLTGGYAELAVARADTVIALPDDITFDTAAALALQGLTALLLLQSRTVRDQRVLVTAAAGGTGSLIAQVAKALGASQVVGLAGGAEKVARLNGLGIDAAIDYHAADWPAVVRSATLDHGADLIVDAVGGSIRPALLDLLAPLGTLVIYGASEGQETGLSPEAIGGLIGKAQSVAGFSAWPLLGDLGFLGEAFAMLFNLVKTGALIVQSGARYPLSDAAEAHRALTDRKTAGKLVLVNE